MEKTHLLYEHILGESADISTSLERLLEKLRGGEKGIIVELPWGERVGEEEFENAQIVLMKLDEKRLYFCNPLPKIEGARGDVGGKEGEGPRRTIEPSGEESMSIEEFTALFQKGGTAILSSLP